MPRMQRRPALGFINTSGKKNANHDKQAHGDFFTSEATFKPALFRYRVKRIIAISLSIFFAVYDDRLRISALVSM